MENMSPFVYKIFKVLFSITNFEMLVFSYGYCLKMESL